MDTKNVLLHLVKAGRDALHADKTLNSIGYGITPYFQIHAEISEAIYAMLDENVDYEESVTYAVMNDIYTPDEMCAEQLAEMIEQPIIVSDTAKGIIADAASKKGMDTNQFINLILNDWARKELIMQNLFG